MKTWPCMWTSMISSIPVCWAYLTPPTNTTPTRKSSFTATPSTGSKAPSWTACASLAGLRVISARGRKWWKPSPRELCDTLKRTPTEAEIAQKLGVGVDRWRRMVLELRSVGLMSASGYASRDAVAPEFPASRESHPDSMCAREELREVLAVAVKTLPERYQKVVLLYYTKEMTMK